MDPIESEDLEKELQIEAPTPENAKIDAPPLIKLSEGVDVAALARNEGSMFEVDTTGMEASTRDIEAMMEGRPCSAREDVMTDAAEGKRYFDPEDIFKSDEQAVPQWDIADDSSRTAFEVMSDGMENISGDGGVVKKLVTPGYGGVAPENAFVSVHYDGFFEYHDEPFDSTRLQNKNTKHRLGSGELIVGLDMALQSMQKAEVAEFIIKHEYAWGKYGCPPRIPAEATVLFRVQLLDWTDGTASDEYFSLSYKERQKADIKLLLKVVDKQRKEARDLFNSRSFGGSLHIYRKLVTMLEDFQAKGEEDDVQRSRNLLTVALNASLAALKMNKPGEAHHYARIARYQKEDSAKAYYFQGKAFMMEARWDQAGGALRKARTIQPESRDIHKALESLDEQKKKQKAAERTMYGRMFGFKNDAKDKPDAGERDVAGDLKGCSSETLEVLRRNIQEFIDDAERQEMALPAQALSPAECRHIGAVATEMGVSCAEVSADNNRHLLIRKMEMET